MSRIASESRGCFVTRGRSATAWGLTLLFIVFALGEAFAELQGPAAADRHVTLMVSRLLKQEHLSKHGLDDEISRRAMKSFLRSLDPMKVYFLQSDVDEFMKNGDRLDDFVRTGDISFAYTVFNRFLKRVAERVSEIDSLVEMEHDFAAQETLVTDPDKTEYVMDKAGARERWRKRIKYELLVRKANARQQEKENTKKQEAGEEVKPPPTIEEIKEKINRRYRNFAKIRQQTDSDELLEMFLTSVTSSFDPHTTYMSPSSLENFHINMKLNLEGIGAALQMEDGYTLVTKIIPGGAADKAGELKAEDRIISVGQGSDGEMVDVLDTKLGDVVKLIRGRAGTIVRLGVMPGGSTDAKEFIITRAKIELKDSEARGEIIEEGRNLDGTPTRVGVIDLPSFYMDMTAARQGLQNYKSTTRDVRRIINDFKSKRVDVVVLDLRQNGGGSLTEAINLTGLFIDNGPVVQVKDSGGRIQHYDDMERGMAWSGPLVVLTSKFSASASEILAGAIQDYRRGIVVGDEATHGKGTVQSLLDLGDQLLRIPDPPNLGALKITMQQFYRPLGESTQKRGVLADIALPSLTTHMDIGESDFDFAIDFDQIPAAPFKRDSAVTLDMVRRLESKSTARRRESKDFQKLVKNIERYREQKEKTTVTLNEAEFMKEREELDADREEEKTFEEQIDGDRPVFERNFYNNEVLAICHDYLEFINQQKVAKLN